MRGRIGAFVSLTVLAGLAIQGCDFYPLKPDPKYRYFLIKVDSVAYASKMSSFTFQGSEILHFRPVPTTSPLAVTDTMRVLFYGGNRP